MKVPTKISGSVDLSKGSLPVLIAVALVLVVASSAYGIGGFVSSLTADKRAAEERFINIGQELKQIRLILEGGTFVKKTEFDAWCRNAEALNRGFKCGSIK